MTEAAAAMLGDIKGKRVLITGSTTGIGAALALELAQLGARVVVHGNKSADKGNQLVQKIRQSGGEAHLVLADISSPQGAAVIVQQAAAHLGGLDSLVNNAGHIIERQTNAGFTPELYQNVFDLNVRSIFAASQAALPHLIASGRGTIINTGSIAARTGGTTGSALYAAAKAAVHTITRNMTREFAPHNIRVNTVAPGFIETPFHTDTPASSRQAALQNIALQRLGSPDDCVGAYIFLMSDTMSGYITGQTLDVNGGQFMP